MKIIDRIERIKEEYSDDYVVRKNGTLLLGLGKIPNCRHMIFKGLELRNLNEYIISEYKLNFPPEYAEFLQYANGANLAKVKIKSSSGVEFAYNLLSIYGLPLTPPFGRPLDMEEPYDMRVEDLARHPNLPKSWLKCGSYIRDNDIHKDVDIFINTEDGRVYACYKNECKIVDEWDCLDECLCNIFDALSTAPREYML